MVALCFVVVVNVLFLLNRFVCFVCGLLQDVVCVVCVCVSCMWFVLMCLRIIFAIYCVMLSGVFVCVF